MTILHLYLHALVFLLNIDGAQMRQPQQYELSLCKSHWNTLCGLLRPMIFCSFSMGTGCRLLPLINAKKNVKDSVVIGWIHSFSQLPNHTCALLCTLVSYASWKYFSKWEQVNKITSVHFLPRNLATLVYLKRHWPMSGTWQLWNVKSF